MISENIIFFTIILINNHYNKEFNVSVNHTYYTCCIILLSISILYLFNLGVVKACPKQNRETEVNCGN